MAAKRTLARELRFAGTGIHSGRKVNLALLPWDGGEVVFCRTDLGGREIRLDPRAAGTASSSYLLLGDIRIQTVEHLLAALAAFGIDSLLVELDGAEIPGLDGSALPFASGIAAAGTKPLAVERRAMKIVESFRLDAGEASVAVSPSDGLRIAYTIVYDHPAVGTQTIELAVTAEGFLREIAPARTFGFLKDAPALKKLGLALGSSLENTVVLDEAKILNGPLRFPDEFVRHKVLDLIGDLALLGAPVSGRFEARRAGHALHLRVVRHLLDHPGAWTWTDAV
jgi:UDP-3-O-[3-hydroxymyristoyl] N-acetylglucosamine deacetylase